MLSPLADIMYELLVFGSAQPYIFTVGDDVVQVDYLSLGPISAARVSIRSRGSLSARLLLTRSLPTGPLPTRTGT